MVLDENTAVGLLERTSPELKTDPDYSSVGLCADLALSVIVPVYNHIDVVERCIDSIIHQKTQYCYEVLLVVFRDQTGSAFAGSEINWGGALVAALSLQNWVFPNPTSQG